MLEILSLCDREEVNFAGKEKENEAFRGVYFFRIREKKFKPNLVFVFALI